MKEKKRAPAEQAPHEQHLKLVAPGNISKFAPYFILLLSLLATLTLWALYDASLKERARLIYLDRTDEISAGIIAGIHENEQILRGAAGLINASDVVNRDEWRRYVETLNLVDDYPGILGVGFSIWLTPSEKEEHVRTIRAEGFPDYVIRPDGQRPVYTSIIYLEPFNWRNKRAFGYDMFFEPVRRKAMEMARDEGVATLAAKIVLLQETDKDVQNGMLMYVPVYRKGMPVGTVEERRAAIQGFAYSPVRFADFIHATLRKIPRDIAFEIFATDTAQPEALMYANMPAGSTALPEGYRSTYKSTKILDVFGAKWLITFRNTPLFRDEIQRFTSYAALAGGIVVSLLLTLIAFAFRKAVVKAYDVARTMAESEARFKGAFQHSAIGMALVAPDGAWLKVNNSLCAMLGYTEGELLSMTFQDITYPDDLGADMDNVKRMLAGEIETYQMEKRYFSKQGEIIWALLAVSLVRNAEGVPLYFISQVENISERKRTESLLRESSERFSAAFDNAPLLFTISALEDGTYLDVNQRFLNITGFTREEVIGKNSVELGWISEGDRSLLKQKMQQDGRISDWELNLKAKSGKSILCKYWGEIIYVAGHKRLLSIGMDITEHRKGEQQQRLLHDQLFHAQKMESIGRLAGGVAHDFNNSLFCVLGFAEIILEKLDAQSSLRSDVEQIRRAAQQAADVTKQLLAFSRKQVLQARPMDLDGLIVNQQKMLHRIIGEDIRIELDLKAATALAIVDASQFQQVLMNLCVNARDAMPQGGPLVIQSRVVAAPPQVESPVIKAGASVVRVSVIDQGVGMPPAMIDRIFEPFFTTKEVGKGTGLGLAVVQGIVKQHGGWIEVASKPGAGTRFDIFLPCAEWLPLSEEEENMPPPGGHGECILLVEDDPIVRQVGAIRLRNLGYTVLEAEGVESGWTQYQSARASIRVLLSDVVLPDGSGVTLAERIAAADPAVRIAFSSGYADERSRVEEITAHGWPFITKPYNLLALARLIESLLSRNAG
jgi:PAS domain S-box-containing protein